MERIMSVDEKIKRAEEIYERRRKESTRPIATVNISEEKKNFKLLKKMIVQILISMLIYFCIYTIQNKEYVFSQDFINKTNEVLSYDTNFMEIYENAKNMVQCFISQNKEEQENNETQEVETEGEDIDENATSGVDENAIGGADEIIEEGELNKTEEQEQVEEQKELTQEEQEIETIKSIASFIKPVEGGIITSSFGQRESTNPKVPTNHRGTDIAANLGTKIRSSTDGEVVLVSDQGDYGKHIKVQIGSVSIIYAHCNDIYVKEGQKILQGQEIAEVGSTGNSTRTTFTF